MKTRLAPTPSGYLHAGNAFNLILTWVLARAMNAKILLRIDDLDQARVRQSYIEDIFRVLESLGLDWDEGPMDAASFEQTWSQAGRKEQYLKAIGRLKEKGHLYACNCSRKEMNEKNHQCHCREKKFDLELFPLRIALDSSDTTDFIIWRREKIPSYHLANIVDDEYFAITHIVRGEDLYQSTREQLALAHLLQATSFTNARFIHHSLIRDSKENKLSKSQQSIQLTGTHMLLSQTGISELNTLVANWLASQNSLSMPPVINNSNDLLHWWQSQKPASSLWKQANQII